MDKGGEPRGRVILGGYGRVGHVVAVLLHASKVPFIVFDNDPARVARGKEDGFPVYYGDIANPELLAAAHAEQAALVVLTVDQEQTALQAISHVRNNYPGIPVIARARDLEASGRLTPGRRDAGTAGGSGEQSSPGCRYPQNGWSAGR